MGRVEGRVALVTGGARGIGKAISEKLASEGAIIVMVDVMLDVAEQGAAEFREKGYEAMALQANVAKMEDAEAAVKAVMDKYGRLDILVNNAGITKDNLMMRMTEDEWDAVIAPKMPIFLLRWCALPPFVNIPTWLLNSGVCLNTTA